MENKKNEVAHVLSTVLGKAVSDINLVIFLMLIMSNDENHKDIINEITSNVNRDINNFTKKLVKNKGLIQVARDILENTEFEDHDENKVIVKLHDNFSNMISFN